MNTKKVLRIFYADFWPGFHYKNNPLCHILQEKYEIIIDEENPDYVIFSCFGHDHLRYDRAIKIYFSGENLGADFNFADYALSSEYLKFGDRYFRLPYWRWYLPSTQKQQSRPSYEKIARTKTKFCNFIYSNSAAAPERRMFFELLSKDYKQVDSGGHYRNNIGGAVKDKIAWQRDYKFSIAFENSSQAGYSTEKIIDALEADTIPIYWGDPCLAQELNPKRFINVHDFDSFDNVIAEVKRLDQDDQAYIDMLAQPWFVGDPPPPLTQDEVFRAWFLHIFEQDKEQARRLTYFGFRGALLLRQRMVAEKIKNQKPLSKKIRPFVKEIERPFRKLRNQFYRLRRKAP